MPVPTLQGDVKITCTGQGFSLEMPGGEISGKVRLTFCRRKRICGSEIHLESSRMSMKAFAELLSIGVVERPVVDVTGLTGSYELAVDMSAEVVVVAGMPGQGQGAVAADPPGASVFASIQNLGLITRTRRRLRIERCRSFLFECVGKGKSESSTIRGGPARP